MKKLILISALATNLLIGSSLEDMLLDTNKKTKLDETKEQKIKYYEVNIKKKKKNEVATLSEFWTKANMQNLKYGTAGEIEGMNKINNMFGEAGRYLQNKADESIKNKKRISDEQTILRYIEIPNNIRVKSNIFTTTIKYKINKYGKIETLNFIKETPYNSLNKKLKKAIFACSNELTKTTAKTINYKFIIK